MKSKLLKIWETIKPAVIIGIVVFILFKVVLLNGFIPSASMEPTLMTDNLVIANRLAYNSSKTPQRGDIIVFMKTDEYDFCLVKRVIGLPGDNIKIKDNKVYLNDELYDEYGVGNTEVLVDGHDEFNVPEGSIFVMGDNRENSLDSRYWDNPYVDLKDVIGKVFLEYSLGGEDGFFIKKISN